MPKLEKMLRMTRRTALLSVAVMLSRPAWADDGERALFWTVTPPGRSGAVLFGYERIAATLTPAVVKDADALVDASRQVVIDMPQNVRLPTVSFDRGTIKPILQLIAPDTAGRLRTFIAGTPAAAETERLSGLEATMLLIGEGQHYADITVGGAVLDHARGAGKRIEELLSDANVQAAWREPDIAALNDKIGDDAVLYLLNLRDRVGPIGAYLETLYLERKSDAILRLTSEMDRHGVFSPSRLLQTDRLRDLMFERALAVLTQPAHEPAFMLVPLGLLAGPSGFLAAFKAKGAAVAPRLTASP